MGTSSLVALPGGWVKKTSLSTSTKTTETIKNKRRRGIIIIFIAIIVNIKIFPRRNFNNSFAAPCEMSLLFYALSRF